MGFRIRRGFIAVFYIIFLLRYAVSVCEATRDDKFCAQNATGTVNVTCLLKGREVDAASALTWFLDGKSQEIPRHGSNTFNVSSVLPQKLSYYDSSVQQQDVVEKETLDSYFGPVLDFRWNDFFTVTTKQQESKRFQFPKQLNDKIKIFHFSVYSSNTPCVRIGFRYQIIYSCLNWINSTTIALVQCPRANGTERYAKNWPDPCTVTAKQLPPQHPLAPDEKWKHVTVLVDRVKNKSPKDTLVVEFKTGELTLKSDSLDSDFQYDTIITVNSDGAESTFWKIHQYYVVSKESKVDASLTTVKANSCGSLFYHASKAKEPLTLTVNGIGYQKVEYGKTGATDWQVLWFFLNKTGTYEINITKVNGVTLGEIKVHEDCENTGIPKYLKRTTKLERTSLPKLKCVALKIYFVDILAVVPTSKGDLWFVVAMALLALLVIVILSVLLTWYIWHRRYGWKNEDDTWWQRDDGILLDTNGMSGAPSRPCQDDPHVTILPSSIGSSMVRYASSPRPRNNDAPEVAEMQGSTRVNNNGSVHPVMNQFAVKYNGIRKSFGAALEKKIATKGAKTPEPSNTHKPIVHLKVPVKRVNDPQNEDIYENFVEGQRCPDEEYVDYDGNGEGQDEDAEDIYQNYDATRPEHNEEIYDDVGVAVETGYQHEGEEAIYGNLELSTGGALCQYNAEANNVEEPIYGNF